MSAVKQTLEEVGEGYILVAEDNLVNQIVIEQTLMDGSRPFVIVENGQEAVDAWRTKAPCLILMDVSMPVLNGLDAIGMIRREEAGSGLSTPIIVVSAHAMSGDREKALDAGADNYVTKPISPNALLEAVEAELQRAVFKTGLRVV